ncbi:hypothetical protein ESCOMMO073B2_22850 [Escherichia coli]
MLDLPDALPQTPSRRTVSAFSASLHNPFSPPPSACCNLPAGFSRLSVPCSVLPDGRYISPAASAGVRKPSAPLRYISAVMPQTRPSPLLPSLWPFQDRPATWRLKAQVAHSLCPPMLPGDWQEMLRFYRAGGSGSDTTAIFCPPHQKPFLLSPAFPGQCPGDQYPAPNPTWI